MRSLGVLLCAVAVALFLCRVEQSTSQEQPSEISAEMPGSIAVDHQMLSIVESTDCTHELNGNLFFNDLATTAVGIHVQEHVSDNEAWPEHAAGAVEATTYCTEIRSGRYSGAAA